MSDQIEELIKEIAAKHGVAVSRDDPILVLQTINNRLMQDSSRAQQIQLDQYKAELEDLALRWGKDAKDKAERILNAALRTSKETMGREMQDGARTLAEAVRAELDTGLAAVMLPIRNARRMALFNVVAACITLLAAGVSLWVVLRVGNIAFLHCFFAASTPPHRCCTAFLALFLC
jgi:multidrug efflux pump subunit AcrA (membrane-fusion protein)